MMPNFRSDVVVKLIDSMASDMAVTRAAQVSVKGENNPETDMPRLIRYLMENRHGSPFEHSVFTFFVEAPIFVFREWHRHRMSSINEMSGRYTTLKPDFYVPAANRKLMNIGTSARPEFAPGTPQLSRLVESNIAGVCSEAWVSYQEMLAAGVANEVARLVLPVTTYSQMYWTVNARSLMNFLSLRIDSPDSTHRSRPQWEIQMGAEQMEAEFARLMPHTHEAFVQSGRMAP